MNVKLGWRKKEKKNEEADTLTQSVKNKTETENDQCINHLFFHNKQLFMLCFSSFFQLAYLIHFSLSSDDNVDAHSTRARAFNPSWVWESDGDLLFLVHTSLCFFSLLLLLLLVYLLRYFFLFLLHISFCCYGVFISCFYCMHNSTCILIMIFNLSHVLLQYL